MLLAHLSDLHLRDETDAIEFALQLDRIVARGPDHLVIAGDLLDRWHPMLLDRALDALAARGFLDAAKLTIIHGNHDLASSGGYPRQRRDLWRLAARFWDPPVLIARRRRSFYDRLAERSNGGVSSPPFLKLLAGGVRIAAIDSVPASWKPFSLHGGAVTLLHAKGAIPDGQCAWLAAQGGASPLLVLMHHYPLPVEPFRWQLGRGLRLRSGSRLHGRVAQWSVRVPMEINPPDRERFWTAARTAGVSGVLCGHVHRARLEPHQGIAVGLNGQSGADWAGRTIAYYQLTGGGTMSAEYESVSHAP